jgi:hypothetical protein
LISPESSPETANKIVTKANNMCASNEFEREEKRDLQEILLQKLQLNLPEILKDEKLKEDLFHLPRDALEILFSNTETCVSEFDLFKSLKEKLD